MSANIRQATIQDAPEIARVHVDSWRTTYKGVVPGEYLDSLDYAVRAEAWKDHLANLEALVFLAEEAGKTCGFIGGGRLREPIGSYDAEIYAIYLLFECQRRGFGRSLMQQLARSLQNAGFRQVAVWVLAENPSCGFYARLGGERIAEKPIEIGGAQLVEVAYGWTHIEDLLQEKYPPQ